MNPTPLGLITTVLLPATLALMFPPVPVCKCALNVLFATSINSSIVDRIVFSSILIFSVC
jgi:hypothetical protein